MKKLLLLLTTIASFSSYSMTANCSFHSVDVTVVKKDSGISVDVISMSEEVESYVVDDAITVVTDDTLSIVAKGSESYSVEGVVTDSILLQVNGNSAILAKDGVIHVGGVCN